ncbi:MAG: hypothetical protein ACKVUS_22240 [Saprospiraceae bacterium]
MRMVFFQLYTFLSKRVIPNAVRNLRPKAEAEASFFFGLCPQIPHCVRNDTRFWLLFSKTRLWICASTSRKFQTFGKLGALLLFALQAQAQAELRTDSNHVETGNPLQMQLRLPVDLGKPDSLNFAAWGDALPAQNIVAETDWDTDGQFFSKTFTALFFDEDSLLLPALPIALPSGDTAYTQPLEIIVTATPSPDDLNDMTPIKNIHREPTRWTDYLPWVLGFLGTLGLLALLFWLAHRKRKANLDSPTIFIPPHKIALKKLDALAQKQLTANGFVKEHYAELTFILREYLEKRFGIPALESTTEETLGYLENRDFPAQLRHTLRHILEQSDLAKFAKIIPSETFHKESFNISRKIILDTV